MIEEWITQGKSYAEVARLFANSTNYVTSERSIRRAVRRWGLAEDKPKQPKPKWEKSGVSIEGDDATVVSDPRAWKTPLNDTDSLLRERGLDPAEWEMDSLIVNEWDSPTGDTLKQLKVHLKRKKTFHMVVPARVKLGKIFNIIPGDPFSGPDPILHVFAGDQQAPHHDVELHKRFCEFLHQTTPERMTLMGDSVDLPTISRHPDDPDWAPKTQECLDAGGQIFVDIRQAAPLTQIRKLPGNHDERLRRAIIDRLGDWYGLRPAQVESLPDLPPIHDPVHLLRLDELAIEYIRPRGSYEHAQEMVSPHLAARHGWLARKGAGASALGTLEALGYNIVVGHTHRQAIVHKTVHDINGKPQTLVAVETGCMCRIQDGLGYAVAPDWQNGFATASVWPDGTFKVDLATYVDGYLYWRDLRF